MFANPYLLEKDERAELVAQLRECVAQHPKVSELRVLFGMALCVNLDIHAAMEELDQAVALDPNSFMAHFKAGELWMRLRVMNKAENHTHQAAKLAQNLAQSEMARRQAAAIRAMKQGGIERGGYMGVWSWVTRLRRLWTRNRSETTVALDVS
jgi:tetratricopeptide (TPR) repeat protein